MENKLLKIAVISGWSHYKLGGAENYCALCFQDWAPKYHVVEFPVLKTGLGDKKVRPQNPQIEIDESLLGWKPHSIVWAKAYPRKKTKKIYEKFDLVILNITMPPRKWINHPKTILVQHMHNKWYTLLGKDWKIIFGQFFSSILFGVGTIINAFKKAHNVVFFAKETTAPTTAKNVFYIPLAHKNLSQFTITKTSGQNFGYIGRLENQQKNIRDLIKIANDNKDVVIYGSGTHLRMLKQKLKNFNQYKGLITKQEIDLIMQELRCLIITSNFEGFPFTIVEALSNGTPVIAFNTFQSLDFFVKSKAVFLIPRGDIKAFNQKISWMRNLNDQEYQKISKDAVDFAKKHLTQETFWRNWDNVLKQVIFYNQKMQTTFENKKKTK